MQTTKSELKDRFDARKHLLLAKMAELKADSRHEAAALRDSIKRELDELEDSLRDGWDNLSDNVRAKLNEILDRK